MDQVTPRVYHPEILSVSRRTDIPFFFAKQFIENFIAGEFIVPNPYTKRNDIIKTDNLKHITFWTKDPINMIPNFHILDEHNVTYNFQYTLNAYPVELEPNVRPLDVRMKQFMDLSNLIGRDRITWRFDPILFAPTMRININHDYIVNAFGFIATELQHYATDCVFSFVDKYTRLSQLPFNSLTEEESLNIAISISKINSALRFPFKLKTCSEKIELDKYNITHSACIDGELIKKLNPSIVVTKDPNQRTTCNCIPSKDIGRFNTCGFKCLYCYAK